MNLIKLRASQGKMIMTDAKTKEARERGELSATTIGYLRQLGRELKYKRSPNYSSKHIEKGNLNELAGLELLSLTIGKLIAKNSERLSNEFFTGETDTPVYLIDGQKKGFDIKSCWDIWTFPYSDEALDPKYEWQNLIYCDINEADEWVTAYTLTNAPAFMIIAEKEALWRKMGQPDETDEVYMRRRKEIEKNMIFDYALFKKQNRNFDLDISASEWEYDIPESERVLMFTTKYDPAKIAQLKERWLICNNYLKTNFNL